MKNANKIVMAIVGTVLIVAAVLKIHQILTTVIPTFEQLRAEYTGFELFMRSLECRELMIFHVPLEMGLGIWMISGIFRKAAWLVGLITFIFFVFVTGYKAVHGYADCGCFGVVKIDPLITLFALDIPVVILLAVFRPKGYKLFQWPNKKYFLAVAIPSVILLVAVTAYLLAAPPVEPEPIEQAGTAWDKLPHIENSDQLKTGMWIVTLFHYNCPDCEEAIPRYMEQASNFEGAINFAFIEVPPYGDISHLPLEQDLPVFVGKLDESKDWMIQTPRVLLLVEGIVEETWDAYAPTIDEIFQAIE